MIFRDLPLLFIAACCLAADPQDDRPDWLFGEAAAYPKSVYLLGIGESASREKAANKARSEIAKSFSLSLTAHTRSSARASGSAFSQEASEDVRTSTAKVLDGVEIARYWRSEKGVHYALAVLHRDHGLKILQDKLAEHDAEFADLSARLAAEEGKFARLRSALKLVELAKARKKISADYRVLNPEGKGVAPPPAMAETLAQARRALAALSVQVRTGGDAAEEMAARLIDALNGYGLKAVERNGQGADLVIEAAAAAQNLPPENFLWFWAEGTAAVKMSYGASGETFSRFEESSRESARGPEAALDSALRALADKSAAHVYRVILTTELSD